MSVRLPDGPKRSPLTLKRVAGRYAAAVPVDPEDAERLRQLARDKRISIAEHNRVIREVNAKGGSVREIARLVGMSHGGVQDILERDEA